MEFIKNYFSGKDEIFIISQCIGLVAAAFLLFSFQQRTHKKILVMQVISGMLFAIQYFMIGAYEGMICNVVGFVRCIAFSFRGKSKFVDSIFCPVLFAVISLAIGIFTYTSPASLLPIFAIAISTFVMWNPHTQQLRALTIPTSLMWLVYNVICSSYSGVITEIFNQISIYIGLFRFRSKKKGE